MSIFSKVALNKPKRNLFNLSHENKFSCVLGQLIPIMCEPVVPGDTFKCDTELIVRMAPMVFPVMQQVDVYVHYFYVPNRLSMGEKNWEKFISPHGTANDPTPTEIMPPCMNLSTHGGDSAFPSSAFDTGQLLDFLGYQRFVSDSVDVPAHILPINAYNLIYANYYMDQNLGVSPEDFVIADGYNLQSQTLLKTKLAANENGNGDLALDLYFKLRQRAWKKDYFTSALPFTQRGADVHLPLYGESAAITGSGTTGVQFSSGAVSVSEQNPTTGGWVNADGQLFATDGILKVDDNNASIFPRGSVRNDVLANNLKLDLDKVNAATINELRRANALQKFLEISARVGARYKEFVLGHFGVNVPDARLQRPEYLGGGVAQIQISEVLQTSSSVTSGSETAPLGDMAGHGIGVGKSNSFTHTFPEHGYVMAIMSIIPKAAYFQGVRRDLLKMDRLDFYQPEFANIGEQPIYNAELYASSRVDPFGTFGYTPRYAEYKFVPSQIHGQFRSTLDAWHMARKFATSPTLSKEFVEVHEYNDDLSRIFAVPGSESAPQSHFFVYANNRVKALRPMPYFGTPTL